MTYDSTEDTIKHIDRVRSLLHTVTNDLLTRATYHDESKLREPEKSAFDRCTPALAETTYGTPEYTAAKAELGAALEHHYEHNDHHPEHFHPELGIHAMDLVQLIEMLADWKAAGERHADGGDLERSIRVNADRFNYGPDMADLLLRTARNLGWTS